MPGRYSRVEIAHWLAVKRNFTLSGTLFFAVGGFLVMLALVEPVIGGGGEFWAIVFGLFLIGGYGWAVGMWYLWFLPVTRRRRPLDK
jgi:hypothetical protein